MGFGSAEFSFSSTKKRATIAVTQTSKAFLHLSALAIGIAHADPKPETLGCASACWPLFLPVRTKLQAYARYARA